MSFMYENEANGTHIFPSQIQAQEVNLKVSHGPTRVKLESIKIYVIHSLGV